MPTYLSKKGPIRKFADETIGRAQFGAASPLCPRNWPATRTPRRVCRIRPRAPPGFPGAAGANQGKFFVSSTIFRRGQLETHMLQHFVFSPKSKAPPLEETADLSYPSDASGDIAPESRASSKNRESYKNDIRYPSGRNQADFSKNNRNQPVGQTANLSCP